MSSLYTHPAQHIITADAGPIIRMILVLVTNNMFPRHRSSTADYQDYLDRDLSEVYFFCPQNHGRSSHGFSSLVKKGPAQLPLLFEGQIT